MGETEKILLHITKDVESLLEQRGIKQEDILNTIHHAETTGEKFINRNTRHFLASFRPDRATYWVEYSKHDDKYEVHTAYSHRTEMKRKGYP